MKPYKKKKKGCRRICKGLRVINCLTTWTHALEKILYKAMANDLHFSKSFDLPAFL